MVKLAFSFVKSWKLMIIITEMIAISWFQKTI